MSEADRDEFGQASSLSWVRIPAVESAFREVAREACLDAAELHVEIVRASVEMNVRGIWRIFLRHSSPKHLIARLPRLYGRAFDGGRIVVDTLANGLAEFHLEDWPDMPIYARRGLAAGAEAVLHVCGRQDVRARPLAGEEARFSVKWRP